MKKFKSFKKKKFNCYFIIIIVILLITLAFINIFGKKLNKNMLNISKVIINDIILNIVNNNIKPSVFKEYSINDFINIKYNNNKISDIDYNLQNSYELLTVIKGEIQNNIKSHIDDYDNIEYYDNYLITNVPFYSITNNLLVSQFGPRIKTRINVIDTIDGSINTKVKSYGINSLLVELYLNINIISSIIVPFSEEKINNNYNILICSKIIQGEIPSIYNGLYEKEGNNLKL